MPLVPKPNAPPVIEDVGVALRKDLADHAVVGIFYALLGSPLVIWGALQGYIELIFLGLAPVVIWGFYRYGKQKQLFMQRFAERYGWSFQETVYPENTYACKLFHKGNGRKLTNVLRGAYEGRALELFHYEYTTGSGKHKQTHFFTVCVIEFAGVVPDIVVEEKRFMDSDGLTDYHHKALSLEGDFGEKFRLYVKEDLEIEALQVLTPEIMEFLMQKGGTYSFEFRGNQLYMVENSHLTTFKDLVALAEFAGELVDKLGPRLSRLHDDVAAIHAAHAAQKS